MNLPFPCSSRRFDGLSRKFPRKACQFRTNINEKRLNFHYRIKIGNVQVDLLKWNSQETCILSLRYSSAGISNRLCGAKDRCECFQCAELWLLYGVWSYLWPFPCLFIGKTLFDCCEYHNLNFMETKYGEGIFSMSFFTYLRERTDFFSV